MSAGSNTILTCAIFGMGRAGKIHYGNIRILSDVKIKYIIDDDIQAAQRHVGELPDVEFVTPDLDEKVFADANLHFCIIASPTFTHESIIRKCIATGKHIFCEKPVAKSIEAMIDCYQLAKEKQVVLHCSYNRRYDPSFNMIKDRIDQVVGDVYTVRTCSRDSPFPPMEYLRSSGGIFHDCAVHDIDIACWMMSDWPVSVFTAGAVHDERLKECNDHDTAIIILKFPNERIAYIEVSRYSSYGYDQRVEVHGNKGMLASNNVCDRAVTASNADGVVNANIQWSFQQRFYEAYQISLANFLSSVRGNSNSRLISAIESVNVSMIATAAEESAKSGLPVAYSPMKEL